jgi:hypothetical protein
LYVESCRIFMNDPGATLPARPGSMTAGALGWQSLTIGRQQKDKARGGNAERIFHL